MKQGNMSFRVSLLTILMVAAFGEGVHPNLATTHGTTTVHNSDSAVIAYWQTKLPRSTMPSAIRDLLTAPAGLGDEISKHNTNNIKMPENLGIHAIEEGNDKYEEGKGGNRNPAHMNPAIIYGKEAMRDNLNPAIIYGKGANEDDLNPTIIFGKEAIENHLNPAIIYGEKSMGDRLNPAIIYAKGAMGDSLKPAIVYGRQANERDLTSEAMGDHINPAIIYGKGANRGKLNPAIIYGKQENKNDLNPAIIYGKGENKDDLNPAIRYGKEAMGDHLNPAIIYGKGENKDDLNPRIMYGKEAMGDNLNPAIIYGNEAMRDHMNPAIIYGKGENKNDLNPEIIYEKEAMGDHLNPAIIYGKGENKDDLNPTIIYGKGKNKDDLNPAIIYGKEAMGDHLKPAIIYGKGENKYDLNPTIIYGKEAMRDHLNPAIIYGKEAAGDHLNPAIIYGKRANRDKVNPAIIYGKEASRDDLDLAVFYGNKGANEDNLNPAIIYGRGANEGDMNPAIIYGKDTTVENLNPAIIYGKGAKEHAHVAVPHNEDGDHHVHGGHDHFSLRKIAFLQNILTPGSKVAAYIHPASPRAPLLRRDAADSIPLSRKSFTTILRMFAPVSGAMAESIWSVLDLCEHPNPAKGEKKACATSVESMVELAESVLGTSDLRAFSSPSVPAKGRDGSKAYRITAVRAITGKGDTMTCHGVTFPFKVFVCHALVPTRVYSVVLESDDDGAEEKMEALVVCHLDTSEFDPEKMPPNVKPGDAPVCHCLNGDDILWAPAATTLGTQGAVDVAVAAQ